MQSPSYFSGIVKILETPQQKVLKNKITTTQFRALLPQSRKNKLSKIVKLTFWGKLASDIKSYYQMDDYILIEGYVSIKKENNKNVKNLNSKSVNITIIKFYPISLKTKEYN